ncbi:histidine kinase [Streptomyces sp. NPDC059009]|uniref:histidine kinase n=1 Tax=Streptomyces sp. NPDC059009 TaxID=3346694 RepID=UPI00369818A0
MADTHHVLLIFFDDPGRCRAAFEDFKLLPDLAAVAVLERSADGIVDVPESHVESAAGYTVGAGVVGGLLGLLAGPAGAFLGLTNAAAAAEALANARDQEGGAALIYVSGRVEEGTAALVADLYEESPQPADDLALRHGGTLERLSAKEFAAQVRAAEKAARKA